MAYTPIVLYLRWRDHERTLCTVSCAEDEATLSLVPYAPDRTFFIGTKTFPTGEASVNIEISDHTPTIKKPHLTIHQSGDVHIHDNRGTRAGPIHIGRLSSLEGQHIASLEPDSIPELLDGQPSHRHGVKAREWPFVVPEEFERVTLAVCINGTEPMFHFPPRYTLALPDSGRPGRSIHVGFSLLAKESFAQSFGVNLSAWDESAARAGLEQDYLFARATAALSSTAVSQIG